MTTRALVDPTGYQTLYSVPKPRCWLTVNQQNSLTFSLTAPAIVEPTVPATVKKRWVARQQPVGYSTAALSCRLTMPR